MLSTSRLSGPSTLRYGTWKAKVFYLRHSVEKSGTRQSRSASRSRLATILVVCRNGILKHPAANLSRWDSIEA